MSGNRIAELLLRDDLALPEAAEFCGVTIRTLERWIREETNIPDDQKRLLAGRFRVSVDYMLGWDREPTGAAS